MPRRSRAAYAAALAAQAPLVGRAARRAHGQVGSMSPDTQLLLPIDEPTQDAQKPNARIAWSAKKGGKRTKSPKPLPKRPRRILGIDPGTKTLGWAIIDVDSDTLVDSGIIEAKGKTLDERLPIMRDALQQLVPRCDRVVYEAPFRTGNRGDQALPQIVAILKLAASDLRIPTTAMYLSAARKLACGYGNADKEAVAEWMRRKFSRELRERGRDWATHDESDAVCIAAAAAIVARGDENPR